MNFHTYSVSSITPYATTAGLYLNYHKDQGRHQMAAIGTASTTQTMLYTGAGSPVFLSSRPSLRSELVTKSYQRVGQLATRTDHGIRAFLAQEVTLPQPDLLRQRVKDIVQQPVQLEALYLMDHLDDLETTIFRSNEVLASAKTVFPLTLFRDDIVVDRTKITITKRDFFFTSQVMSIRIEDVLNVKVALGPFFGSVTIVVRVLSSEDHHTINFLWRKDAIHLKHIIQGYIIAQHNQIDISHQTKQELTQTLSRLGHDRG